MTLTPGTCLGAYEVLAPLGSGGMGDVYRARDTRLHREVALKVMSRGVESDPTTLHRFQREARTVAALNHPHIVTIYSVEESDGRVFLAMELLEGHTLADLIPSHGLPIDTLLRYAIPLADALSAAHTHGITHRDLKPANVMVTKDGRVKVLDFGLAKLRDQAVQMDATLGPTEPLTGQGHIIGTVAYMSPEQATAGAVDERSDLFSFGVMLYEMATGTRPFKGERSMSTLAAILKDTPKPITDLRPHLPRDLSRIVRRALAKDPEQRYQTAKDLRNDLQTLKDDLTSGDLSLSAAAYPGAPARSRSTTLIWTLGIVAIVAVAAAGVLAVRSRAARPSSVDTITMSRVTSAGNATAVALSPDGKYVAHVVSDRGFSLWMQQVATSSNVQIVTPGPERFFGLTFSPDGTYVYFTRLSSGFGANVYRVPVLGGVVEKIIQDADSPVTFAPDGKRLAFVRGYPARGEVSVMTASSAGGDPPLRLATRKFSDPYQMYTRIGWSPDGKTIVAAAGGEPLLGRNHSLALVAIDSATGKERPLTSALWGAVGGVAWLRGGEGLIISGTETSRPNYQLWRVGLSDGHVRRITNDLNSYQDVGEATSAAIVTLQSDLSSTVSIATPPAIDLTPVTAGAGRYDGQLALTWTPSGRVIFSSAAGGFSDLWIADADGRNARQLTSDPAAESGASVTPDGRSVVFVSEKNGRPGIWRLEIDSGRLTQLTDNATDVLPHCLPDGKTVVFSRTESQPYAYRVSLDGGGATRISEQIANTLDVSPDGRFAATFTREIDPSKWLIGLLPLDGSRMTQGFDIVTFPLRLRWTSDGTAITYLESRRETQSLWNQPMKGGVPQLLLDLHGDHVASFAWSRDGRLAIAEGKGTTDVVLLSGVQ